MAILLTALIYALLVFVIGLITLALVWTYSEMNIFLFIVCFVLFNWILFGLVWGTFQAVCAFFILMVRQISPSVHFAVYTFAILMTLGAIFNIYSIWTANENVGFAIFMNILLTLATLGFTNGMIKVAGHISEPD